MTRPHALESLAVAEVVVFDKTGTLTEGRPRLVAVETARGWSRERALAVAAALERGSEHPLATAIRSAADGLDLAEVDELVNRPGRGVVGTIAGEPCALGSPDFVVSTTAAAREPDPMSSALQARSGVRGSGRVCVARLSDARSGCLVAAIREGREPNASVAQVLPCYQVLGALEKQLEAQR